MRKWDLWGAPRAAVLAVAVTIGAVLASSVVAAVDREGSGGAAAPSTPSSASAPSAPQPADDGGVGSTTAPTASDATRAPEPEPELPQDPPPTVVLEEDLQGAEAVEAVGDDLDEVAVAHGLSGERLAEVLVEDETSWLDTDGRLYHVEELAPAGAPAAGGSDEASPIAAAADTFRLHSRPGSNRVIYLDFNGHVATGTGWSSGTITAQPFSRDADLNAFSSVELTMIQEAWQAVANDFAPFDVDVTTEEPPADRITRTDANDQLYGSRAVITDDTWGEGGGGVAYVGTFDYYGSRGHGYYQPAWVFNDGSAQSISITVSHEIGHNLGLGHDGTTSESYYDGHGSGATSWGPIMGSPFGIQVTQWSRGDYPAANNTEDDLAVMATNGIDPLADDVTARAALTTTTAGGSATVDQDGRIETSADVDEFSFQAAAGPARFTVEPLTPPYVNLDAVLSLHAENGTQLASANDPDGLGGTIDTTLAAGRYFLRVRPTGDTNPSPGYPVYGSLGDYGVTGTFAVGGGTVDTTPDAFSFAPVTGAAVGSTQTSGPATISGITGPAAVRVAGGSYSIDGGAFTTAAGSVAPGSTVRVRHTASASPSTAVTTTLTVGGVSGSFTSTTAAPTDTTPDAFSFVPVTGAAVGSTQTSGSATIGGITGPAAVRVAGGSYSIDGGAFTTAAGSVSPGSTVRVRHTASASPSTAVTTTLTVGGVSGTFSSTTASAAPCTACTRHTGSLGAGASAYVPGTGGFTTAAGTLRGYLRGPAGTDFDLHLERFRPGSLGLGGSWSAVASATGTGPDEDVSFTATAGTYRWRIRAYSGAGAYTFWMAQPTVAGAPVDGGTYSIQQGGRAVDVPGSSTAVSEPLIVWSAHSGANQRWAAAGQSDGTFTFRSVSSGLCLDNRSSSTAAGNPIIQWHCTGSANQRWQVVPSGTGFTLVNAGSGLALTGGSANGSPLVQQPQGAVWTFVPVS